MSALGSLYIRLGEPDGELGGCCETADWAAEYIEGLLAGQASVIDVLVQEAALVGENMILKSQVAELEQALKVADEGREYANELLAGLKAQAGEVVDPASCEHKWVGHPMAGWWCDKCKCWKDTHPTTERRVPFGKSDSIRHLAENIMTDCGCSTEHDDLRQKIEGRLWDYFDAEHRVPEGWKLVPISQLEDTCPCCCQWSEDHSAEMLNTAPAPTKDHGPWRKSPIEGEDDYCAVCLTVRRHTLNRQCEPCKAPISGETK